MYVLIYELTYYSQKIISEFQLVVEFNGDESSSREFDVICEDLPVAHTCVKTMKLPGSAYNADAKKFKDKLLTTLNSLPRGYFDMN